MTTSEKLFVIIRQDLEPGLQIAQALHGFREFVEQHKEVEDQWFKTSNTIAILSVPTEKHLQELVEKARQRGIKYSSFREPDRGDELTAVTIEPRGKNLCRGLPLALRTP